MTIPSPESEQLQRRNNKAKIVKTNWCTCLCCGVGTAPYQKDVLREKEDGEAKRALHIDCFRKHCEKAGIVFVPTVTSINQAEKFIEGNAQKLMYSRSKREQEILFNLSLFYQRLTGASL